MERVEQVGRPRHAALTLIHVAEEGDLLHTVILHGGDSVSRRRCRQTVADRDQDPSSEIAEDDRWLVIKGRRGLRGRVYGLNEALSDPRRREVGP